MPWCDKCDEYRAPTALSGEGACASCGSRVDVADIQNPPPVKAPWHFWVMVAALVAYLGWRVVEAAIWLIERF